MYCSGMAIKPNDVNTQEQQRVILNRLNILNDTIYQRPVIAEILHERDGYFHICFSVIPPLDLDPDNDRRNHNTMYGINDFNLYRRPEEAKLIYQTVCDRLTVVNKPQAINLPFQKPEGAPRIGIGIAFGSIKHKDQTSRFIEYLNQVNKVIQFSPVFVHMGEIRPVDETFVVDIYSLEPIPVPNLLLLKYTGDVTGRSIGVQDFRLYKNPKEAKWINDRIRYHLRVGHRSQHWKQTIDSTTGAISFIEPDGCKQIEITFKLNGMNNEDECASFDKALIRLNEQIKDRLVEIDMAECRHIASNVCWYSINFKMLQPLPVSKL
jgi:hypothetical protein